MNNQCPNCQSEIKTIPAGVSQKTGRPYNAFQACSNRDCNWKPPKPTFTPKPSAPVQAAQITSQSVKEAQGRKEESINRFNALNAAISLVSRHPLYKDLDEVNILMAVFDLQQKFYQQNSKPENFPAF